MTIMYDSVTAAAIPQNAAVVAGYVDGKFAWSSADWALFPNAYHVRITVFGGTLAADVIDVENGDATPATAVQWASDIRAVGRIPIVYCNENTWPSVETAFASIAPPVYWIANYDGAQTIPNGADAKQYMNTPSYDLSVVDDYFLSILGGKMAEFNVSDMTPDGIDFLARVMSLHQNAPDTHSINWGPSMTLPVESNGIHAALASIATTLADISTKVDGLVAAQSSVSGSFTITGSGTVS